MTHNTRDLLPEIEFLGAALNRLKGTYALRPLDSYMTVEGPIFIPDARSHARAHSSKSPSDELGTSARGRGAKTPRIKSKIKSKKSSGRKAR